MLLLARSDRNWEVAADAPRIALPMVGGVVTSALLELLVYPALYSVWRVRRLWA